MGVQFEDEQFSSVRMNARPPSTGLAGRLIKAGWAKDAKQANTLLLITSVALLVVAWFLISGPGSNSSNNIEPTEEESMVGL